MEGWPNSWRVSYVRDTGEIYAVRQGPIRSGILPTGEIFIANGPEEGPVLLLGHFPIDKEAGPRDVYYRGLEKLLEGWPERCVQPNGLVWVIEKLGESPPALPTSLDPQTTQNQPGRTASVRRNSGKQEKEKPAA